MFEGELAWNKVRRRFSNDFHNAVRRLSARNDMPFPFETQPITEGEPVTLWNGEDSNTQRGLSSYMDMDLKKRDKLVPDNWSDWCDGRRSITWDGVPQSIESHAAHSFSHRSKVFFFLSLSLKRAERIRSRPQLLAIFLRVTRELRAFGNDLEAMKRAVLYIYMKHNDIWSALQRAGVSFQGHHLLLVEIARLFLTRQLQEAWSKLL